MILAVEFQPNTRDIKDLYYDENVECAAGEGFESEKDILEFLLNYYRLFPRDWYDCDTGEKWWYIIPFTTVRGMEDWINKETGLTVKITVIEQKRELGESDLIISQPTSYPIVFYPLPNDDTRKLQITVRN